MKKLQEIKGVKELNKSEQKSIAGGNPRLCTTNAQCKSFQTCIDGICTPWRIIDPE